LAPAATTIAFSPAGSTTMNAAPVGLATVRVAPRSTPSALSRASAAPAKESAPHFRSSASRRQRLIRAFAAGNCDVVAAEHGLARRRDLRPRDEIDVDGAEDDDHERSSLAAAAAACGVG
jgi:hypothetical protein